MQTFVDYADEDINNMGQLTHEFWNFAEKMQPVFALLKWEWYSGPISKQDIVDTLQELFDDLRNTEGTYMGTGGLFVAREENDLTIYHFGFEVTGPHFSYPFKHGN